MTNDQDQSTFIIGDIDAFLNALEGGTMQAQWDEDQARYQALLARYGSCTPAERGPDASDD